MTFGLLWRGELASEGDVAVGSARSGETLLLLWRESRKRGDDDGIEEATLVRRRVAAPEEHEECAFLDAVTCACTPPRAELTTAEAAYDWSAAADAERRARGAEARARSGPTAVATTWFLSGDNLIFFKAFALCRRRSKEHKRPK